ncbi:MAG: ATP-dependent zinc metalloprotease FtsH [Candidatus Improbicoccus devescovinae]|nr:MAG: ATP-dependent zinc metalloprotease FtsH [Candidatus Improbicoccus devescovinae]
MNNNNNKKRIPRNMIIFLGIPILIILISTLFNSLMPKDTTKYSQIINRFRQMEVVEYSMNLGSGDLKILLKDKQEIKYTVPSVQLFYDDIKIYVDEYNKKNPDNPMVYNLTKAAETSWFVNAFTFVVLPMIVIGIMGWILLRKITVIGGDATRSFSFGKAKPKANDNGDRKTTFANVAGADEEKEELAEIVDFLKSPKKYNDLGARIPKGVLLIGPPGTGKTLLARAVAGEADIPFFSMSGSDFVEMFVGVGASRVRDLFEQAKKSKPCVIFIDEIDAVGRRRGAGLGGGHDEREQTLNQLLVEMDGFGTNEGVIMLAATNRPDILDPALMRPGRFDRNVVVGYPDVKGREEILRIHAKGKPFDSEVMLKTIAKSTAGFTGADLENLLNESALLAARRGKNLITSQEIRESTVKVLIGTEKKSRLITDREKKMTAYHEGGHAIVTYFCPTQDPVHEISIIPRGLTGGYTLSIAEKDEMCTSRTKMCEYITVALGGRIAEFLIFGEISTGASSDIEHATKTARSMITKYGMSETLGPICYNNDSSDIFIGRDMGHFKTYSEHTAAEIDLETKDIIKKCYEKSENILKTHMKELNLVADYLISHEKINGEEFSNIMRGAID